MYDLAPLLERLEQHADEKYRVFNESLTPGARGMSIGVRAPVLRKIAKDILRDDPNAFLDASLGSSVHELNMLHAMVLCKAANRFERLRAFVPTIGNWAVCDTLCNDLKILENHEPWLDFLLPYAESESEYECRFGCVMLMLYFRGDDYADAVFDVYRRFRHEGYYARMGVAWGLSYLFVDQRERTLSFFRNSTLDRFTHNKAIQKCLESYRVSAEDKQLLRTLRR